MISIVVFALAAAYLLSFFVEQDMDDCKTCPIDIPGSCNVMATEENYYGYHKHMKNNYTGVGFYLLSSNHQDYLNDCADNVTWEGLMNNTQSLTSSQICCLFRSQNRNITNCVMDLLGPTKLSNETLSAIVDIVFSDRESSCGILSSDQFMIQFIQLIKKKDFDSAAEALKKTGWCKNHSTVPAQKGAIDRCSRDIKCIKTA